MSRSLIAPAFTFRRATLALAVGLLALGILRSPDSELVPLDLPRADAQPGPGQVPFYGQVYPSDSFVWCLDTSCSMGWDNSHAAVQSEVADALAQLTPSQEFSLVLFSDAFSTYSSVLLLASAATVAAATAWLNGATTSGTTCPGPALIASLGILQTSTTGTPALFYVTNGLPSCTTPSETIAEVTAANTTLVLLHAVQVGVPDAAVAQYLQDLSAANGGSYLDAGSISPDFERGDVNGDGVRDLADAIAILSVSFQGSMQPICEDAADANDDGLFQGIPDAIALLNHLFIPGTPGLPTPFPDCGTDPTSDTLPCIVNPCP